MTNFAPNTQGIFPGLPHDVYRKAPGTSQSMLKDFDSHATPLHFKNAEPKKPTEDMEFGTICHTAVLEPKQLPVAYYLQHESYPDGAIYPSDDGKLKPWHGGSSWCKAWEKDHSDRPVIDREKEDRIPKIVERVSLLEPFRFALEKGQREVSFFKQDEETGLLLKARADVFVLTVGGEKWIFDLKKVQAGAASEEEFGKHALDLGYHIQAASYMAITGAVKFIFVVFDDAKPFDAIQYEPDQEMLDFGRMEWRRILERYAACVKSDSWPGYASGINKLSAPPWARKQIAEGQKKAMAAWAMKVARETI